MKKRYILPLIALVVAGYLTGPTNAGNTNVEDLQRQIKSLTAKLEKYRAEEANVKRNLALMRATDEAMNARNWQAMAATHSHDVLVNSPDSPKPTTNRDDHMAVVKSFVNAFPDHKIELPYKILIGSGDSLCAVHENGGTFTQPWILPGNAGVIPPNGKRYTMRMVTVGKVKNGKLVEEMIIYDMASMMRQLGLTGPKKK